jgi:light-regulated signal transduction histidine kinase (bacteriophytochrome)
MFKANRLQKMHVNRTQRGQRWVCPGTKIVPSADGAVNLNSCFPPNVGEARIAMKAIVKQAYRASGVITKIRDLLLKSPSNISIVDVNQLIEEVLVLIHQQAAEHGVKVRAELASDAPSISCDSVQLQQVMVNLILKAIEATSARESGARELLVSSQCQGQTKKSSRSTILEWELIPSILMICSSRSSRPKRRGLAWVLPLAGRLLKRMEGGCGRQPRMELVQLFSSPYRHNQPNEMAQQ